MRIVHWVRPQGSGLARVAQSLSAGEVAQGLASACVDPDAPATWGPVDTAEVHVVHHHLPDAARARLLPHAKTVFVAHGTPEHVLESTLEAGRTGYGHADPFMMLQHWLRTADAFVTFWPRHAQLYRTMVPDGRAIDVVPLGVDRDFWCPGESQGAYVGSPSVFTAENQHRIKWVLDLLLAWPLVTAKVPEARLHAIYLPHDQHRVWFPLANANGAAYRSYLSAAVFQPDALRNAFRSTDMFLGLVRYGDFNHLGLQAAASGATCISYTGNPYAHHWVPEGDHDTLATALARILRGEATPRTPEPVPTLDAMVQGFQSVYRRLRDVGEP